MEEAEARESGFVIDDKRYEIPRLDTITLDEERILYVYADTVLQDFAPAHPDMPDDERAVFDLAQLRKVRNPDFKRALAHIAYRREHPEEADADIQKAIGAVNALEVDIALLRGDDEDPPATSSQKQPAKPSATSTRSKPTDSGSPTESDSDPVDETREATGTTESDTSSPGATRLASVS